MSDIQTLESSTRVFGDTYTSTSDIRHYTGTPGADNTCHIVTLSRLWGYLVSTLCCKLWCSSELRWRMIINCWRGGLIFIKSQTAAWWLVRQNQSLLRDCRHRAGNFVWIQNINTATANPQSELCIKHNFSNPLSNMHCIIRGYFGHS